MHQMVNVLFPSPSALSYPKPPADRDTLSTVSISLKIDGANWQGQVLREEGEAREGSWTGS